MPRKYYPYQREFHISFRRFLQLAIIVILLTIPDGLVLRLDHFIPAKPALLAILAALTVYPFVVLVFRSLKDLLDSSHSRHFERYRESLTRKSERID